MGGNFSAIYNHISWADILLVNIPGFPKTSNSGRVEMEAHVFLCLVGNRVPPYNHLFAGFEKAFVLKVKRQKNLTNYFLPFKKELSIMCALLQEYGKSGIK